MTASETALAAAGTITRIGVGTERHQPRGGEAARAEKPTSAYYRELRPPVTTKPQGEHSNSTAD